MKEKEIQKLKGEIQKAVIKTIALKEKLEEVRGDLEEALGILSLGIQDDRPRFGMPESEWRAEIEKAKESVSLKEITSFVALAKKAKALKEELEKQG